MKYRLLLSDIDGTLRPGLLPQIPTANVKAIRAIQRYGVKFAIATGRARSSIPEEMLNGLEPDYWICAAGAQVLERDGSALACGHMEPEQVEALTAFCTEEDYELIFAFSDGSYAYVGYEKVLRRERELGFPFHIKNGTDRSRHLTELPISAAAQLPKEATERFQKEYGSLGLQFVYYMNGGCDILRPGQDKSLGLIRLAEHIGLNIDECVSVGDGNNDVGILRTAGLSFCVEGGEPDALAAADRVCPSAENCGVAAVCRMIWPEALSGQYDLF